MRTSEVSRSQKGVAVPADFDLTILHAIWRETDRKLTEYSARVREGLEVLPASDFARWLQFSGILRLLEPFDCDVPLPIRARELRQKCDVLIADCGEWFSNHERSNKPRDPLVPRSELERITKALADLQKQVSLLSPPLTATTEAGDTAEPALVVLQGGRMSERASR